MDTPIEPHKVDLELGTLPPLERTTLRLVLDNIRSAHNTGALLRTADACCVDLVYLVGVTPHPPQPQLEKTALGATKYVPWKHRAKAESVLTELEADGYRLVALDNGPGAVDYWDLDWPERTALVAGNEVDGVSADYLYAASLKVNIPMLGYKRSLNVTTAMGIAMYDYLRTFRSRQGLN